MKKGTKIFLALLVVVALALGGVSVFYSQQLTEQTQTIAKKHLHHFLSIAARLKDLQDALLDKLFDDDNAVAVDGTLPDTEALSEPPTEAITEAPPEPVTQAPHEYPETTPAPEETTAENTVSPPDPLDTAPATEAQPPQSYTVKAYQGIIGVFDQDGSLVDMANVSVITLPDADRRALEEGIFAASMAEVQKILDKLT